LAPQPPIQRSHDAARSLSDISGSAGVQKPEALANMSDEDFAAPTIARVSARMQDVDTPIALSAKAKDQ